jgi:acyl-CoA reductase-like NAD-dependent aldehyde dehydrogenase
MNAQLQSIDPATGDVVGTVDVTPTSAIADVVARARAAHVGWNARSLDERLALMRKASARLAERASDIGLLGTREMGKPLREMAGEAAGVADLLLSDLDEMATAFADDVQENERSRTTVYRDGFGVAACISPWNFPVLMPHTQIIPALAAGNAVVFKPSERSPLTGAAYAQCLIDVLPPDVLQIVQGDGEQGRALVQSDVDLIVFTGSRAAGVHILQAASGSLKRVILELGGKDPLVVLDDADLDAAATFAAGNSFRNAGQVCVSTERIYVQEGVHDTFVDRLVAVTKKMLVGDGKVEGTRVGPMVDGRQKAHVVAQVDRAVELGATIAYQGRRNDGNYVSPVVLTNISHDMPIAMDETFGPVACVIRVHDDAQAVALANDTPYGLGAVVFGAPDRARAVARQLTAGMIGVNQGIGSVGSTRWVGARQSGHGFHSGMEGHRQFAQVRVLTERL